MGVYNGAVPGGTGRAEGSTASAGYADSDGVRAAAVALPVAAVVMQQRTSHAVHAGEPFAQLVAHVLSGRRRGAERPQRRRPRLVMVLVRVLVLVVPAVSVVSAARDACAADAAPEPIAATRARPPSAAQASGQHQRQHRAHGQHRRQHHVVHGLRFHRTCQTQHAVHTQRYIDVTVFPFNTRCSRDFLLFLAFSTMFYYYKSDVITLIHPGTFRSLFRDRA